MVVDMGFFSFLIINKRTESTKVVERVSNLISVKHTNSSGNF